MILQTVKGGNGSLGRDENLRSARVNVVVRERRDVADSVRGNGVVRERRDVTVQG